MHVMMTRLFPSARDLVRFAEWAIQPLLGGGGGGVSLRTTFFARVGGEVKRSRTLERLEVFPGLVFSSSCQGHK